jgi:peptidoglycan/xylan/chitin deacetylase (PgdA/CDA1 family)
MMTWDEARIWANHGIEFGSHSMTHPDLTTLSQRALKAELHDSRTMIEDELGRPVRYLSYPFGRHNARVRDAAREAGYLAAFGITPQAVDPHDRFAIGRLMVGSLTTMGEIRKALADPGNVSARSGPSAWRRRFLHSLNAGSATVAAWRRWTAAAARSDVGTRFDDSHTEPRNMKIEKV